MWWFRVHKSSKVEAAKQWGAGNWLYRRKKKKEGREGGKKGRKKRKEEENQLLFVCFQLLDGKYHSLQPTSLHKTSVRS